MLTKGVAKWREEPRRKLNWRRNKTRFVLGCYLAQNCDNITLHHMKGGMKFAKGGSAAQGWFTNLMDEMSHLTLSPIVCLCKEICKLHFDRDTGGVRKFVKSRYSLKCLFPFWAYYVLQENFILGNRTIQKHWNINLAVINRCRQMRGREDLC